ncbi:MAG: DEAD/DEAH box helicase, partial [Alphaproteobacteria bacterium]|nr:DEAD/DEAH box helicase [Alphaproteobacteria bacterium]
MGHIHIRQELENTARAMIYGAPEGQDARILADKARALMPSDKVLVHIALDDARMAELKELLGFFAPDVRVVEFPAWDCLPYDRVSPGSDIIAHRVSALAQLLDWEQESARYARIILTTVNAVLQRVMPREALKQAALSVQVGERLDRTQLERFLSGNGYIRSETVREAGEYAVRGGIIDLFPPSCSAPVRIDLFGDTVETLRAFDPLSQRTQDKIADLTLRPVSEFFLNEESIERFRAGYRSAFGVVNGADPLYEAVSAGRRYNGMEHWLPLFYTHMETLFDYVPGAAVTMDHHADQAGTERLAQIEDFYQARRTLEDAAGRKKPGKSSDVSLSGAVYHPLPVDQLYTDGAVFLAGAEMLSPFGGPDEAVHEGFAKKGRDFADIRALPDGNVFGELKKHLAALSRKTLIAAYSEGSGERLKTLMETAGIGPFSMCRDYGDIKKLGPGKIGLAILSLERGFAADDLAVITEQDILGDRLARKAKKKRQADNFLTEISALSEGDLVVHVDHGIGRFVALETLEAAGKLHDCLKIEYAGGDKLFVPVENIDVLSRFGADEGTVPLDKLGGAGWQARKARVKKDLMIMADGLLKIAAARLLRKGPQVHVSESLYTEFASRFPYQETEDQDRAITSVLEDMGKDHPMDRLVCGDVGFGKTEVALRAAYAAAMEGLQVALVVPTTLLARQHYKNFMARFAGTGLRIEQLSRLVSAREAKHVKEGLADGRANIVIGTHALFGKGMKFANLGLLIVDEEQRFGVKQKEKLKELKNNVHVLTLTATPIP